MLFLVAVIISLVVGSVSGGKISRLGEIEIDRVVWIASSFLIKMASSHVLTGRFEPSSGICLSLSMLTYLTLFYGLYPNLRLPGFTLLTAGAFSNFLVIIANGGRMPVDLSHLEPGVVESQIPVLMRSLTHCQLITDTKLKVLADIFSWRFLIIKPTTFSIGDVLMAAGVFFFVLKIMHRDFGEWEKGDKIRGDRV
ncbi:MAG TPA: DUF5317 domain-containing protein [Bacillota bacterium]|nr:DUF5317 domain-containing protein [Bacillota bacterium]